MTMDTIDEFHACLRDALHPCSGMFCVVQRLHSKACHIPAPYVSLTCDSACTMLQVHRLLLVLLPEANVQPAERRSAPQADSVLVRPPASAPSDDGNVQQLAAQVGALEAAIQADKDKHSTTMEALKAAVLPDKELAAELEALKAAMQADKAKHHAELEALKAANQDLQGQVLQSFHGV